MKKAFLLSIASMALLAACGSNEVKEGETKQATARSSESVVSESTSSEVASSEEPEVENEGVIARQTYTADWKETWKDVEFAITDISIVQLEKSALEENNIDGEGILGIKFVITNNSEETITTYPDQANLVIDGSQTEADMFSSDHLGGDILSGVTKEGVVVFPVKNLQDVDDVKSIRVSWPAHSDDFSDVDDMSKNFDVTLDLQ